MPGRRRDRRGAGRWLARLLVAAFPPGFRRELGADMAQLFVERWRDARDGVRAV